MIKSTLDCFRIKKNTKIFNHKMNFHLKQTLTIFSIVLSMFFSTAGLANKSLDGVWTKKDSSSPFANTEKSFSKSTKTDTNIDKGNTNNYISFEANIEKLSKILELAPLIEQKPYGLDGVALTLPTENGEYIKLEVFETQIMSPELAKKYPSIKTYKAFGINKQDIIGHLDMSPRGFRAMLKGQGKSWFIENLNQEYKNSSTSTQNKIERIVPSTYNIIRKNLNIKSSNSIINAENSQKNFECGFKHSKETLSSVSNKSSLDSSAQNRATFSKRNGGTLLTYRIAVAAVEEYSAAVSSGPANKSDTQAAIVTAINRVNMIFNQDLAIHLELVANNDALIFLESDPFANNAGADIGRITGVINNIIGNSAYDIGHLFTVDGGGLAFFRSVCSSDGDKAGGVTGVNAGGLQSDAFYIDFLAHELGHQFGANHTFNGTSGSCGGGNRNASTAFEPGSGSTIMAYAGICDTENIQNESDPYFHAGSIDEIFSFIKDPSTGGSCATSSNTGETPPTVNGGNDYQIPAHTPFKLSANGSGTDISYTWEQMDTGSSTSSLSALFIDNGNRAIFRSFLGTSNSNRYFPTFDSISTGIPSLGEAIPNSSRRLNFRVTARAGAYGIADDDVLVQTHNTGSPFELQEPQQNSYQFESDNMNVIWDTGGSEKTPINCSQVNISLATDGGLTSASFTIPLATNTPNDGNQIVTLPAGTSSTNRLLIECSNNVFYSINNGSFNTIPAGAALFSISASNNPATEGNLNQTPTYTYTVTRFGDGSLTNQISYNVEPHGLNPTDADDFPDVLDNSGTLDFAAGETEKTIEIRIQGDIKYESDEEFKVSLSNPLPSNNSFISVFSAYSIITNDDLAPSNSASSSSGGNFSLTSLIFIMFSLMMKHVIFLRKKLIWSRLILSMALVAFTSVSLANCSQQPVSKNIEEKNHIAEKGAHPQVLALRTFTKADPLKDAQDAISKSDIIFFASAPRGQINIIGLSAEQKQKVSHHQHKIQVGMGDVIFGREHMQLRTHFLNYASQYNQTLYDSIITKQP